MSSSTVNDETQERKMRDGQLLLQIRGDEVSRKAASDHLWQSHYDRLERRIAVAMRLKGLRYDAGSSLFNSVFERVLEGAYSPDALLRVTEKFDVEKGSLDRWLLKRAFFETRDAVKSIKDRGEHQLEIDAAQIVERSKTDAHASATSGLEVAMAKMNPQQRASLALLLLPNRSLTDDDWSAISIASGNEIDALRAEVEAIQHQHAGPEIGRREASLVNQISFWHQKLLHEQRMHRHLSRSLRECGLSDRQLDKLESVSRESTIQQIQTRYLTRKENTPADRQLLGLQKKFEVCCRQLDRCQSRLERLRAEYVAARSLPLLGHEQIAQILGCTANQVSTYLWYARKKIEREQERHKTAS